MQFRASNTKHKLKWLTGVYTLGNIDGGAYFNGIINIYIRYQTFSSNHYIVYLSLITYLLKEGCCWRFVVGVFFLFLFFFWGGGVTRQPDCDYKHSNNQKKGNPSMDETYFRLVLYNS